MTTRMTISLTGPAITTGLSMAGAPATQSGISGAEPTPGSPEALLLLAGLGVLPAGVAKADRRFSPEAIRRCLNRLLEVRQQQELLSAEQKELHEQLRLAHLRGDLGQQLPAGKDGQGYQIKPDLLLYRRAGRKQWHYSLSCQELACQLKARQSYEQQIGEASYHLGAPFWELRPIKV